MTVVHDLKNLPLMMSFSGATLLNFYWRVLKLFCEFLRFGKDAKLSTRKSFYQHIRHSGVQLKIAWRFQFWTMHIHSLLIVSAFSFLPSRAITRSRRRLMISMILGVSWENLDFVQILFSFSSDKDRRTDSRIRRKNTTQPCRESNPGSCEI